MFSTLNQIYGNWCEITIFFCSDYFEPFALLADAKYKIITFYNNSILNANNFLSYIAKEFHEMKEIFSQVIPLQPFHILIDIKRYTIDEFRIVRRIDTEEDSEEDEEDSEEDEEDSEEDEEEREEVKINADKTFKSGECVICLTNPPNV